MRERLRENKMERDSERIRWREIQRGLDGERDSEWIRWRERERDAKMI